MSYFSADATRSRTVEAILEVPVLPDGAVTHVRIARPQPRGWPTWRASSSAVPPARDREQMARDRAPRRRRRWRWRTPVSALGYRPLTCRSGRSWRRLCPRFGAVVRSRCSERSRLPDGRELDFGSDAATRPAGERLPPGRARLPASRRAEPRADSHARPTTAQRNSPPVVADVERQLGLLAMASGQSLSPRMAFVRAGGTLHHARVAADIVLRRVRPARARSGFHVGSCAPGRPRGMGRRTRCGAGRWGSRRGARQSPRD